jgi:hypothetical protein
VLTRADRISQAIDRFADRHAGLAAYDDGRRKEQALHGLLLLTRNFS